MPGPFYFAWTGGTISEPITLATTGDTHGGEIETFSASADVTQIGGNELKNVQSATALDEGGVYQVAGASAAGIPDGTLAIYLGSGIIALGANASQVLTSLTLTLTKTATIGTTIATFTAGSPAIVLADTSALLIGSVYGIAGDGIPSGALFVYEGGASVTIATIVDNVPPVPPGGFPLFAPSSGSSSPSTQGPGTVITTSSPAAVPALRYTVSYSGGTPRITNIIDNLPATGSTLLPQLPFAPAGSSGGTVVTLSGFLSAAATVVDNVKSFAGLTPGLQYNIAGPGVQAGATFVMPAAAGPITLDRPATSAALNVPLIITGPRVPNAPFDPVADAREDEDILGFEINHLEGDFAALTITLKNPQIGFLAPGRRLWCWLSYNPGTGPVPLFNGRLIGLPKRITGEAVELQFIARPDDFFGQKLALATAKQVLPWWDPVWLSKASDPDLVLETYSELWHIDPVTLSVTASDIIQGEAGTVAVTEDDSLYDSFSMTYGQPPLTAVSIEGTVAWTQEGSGTIDLTSELVAAFADAGSSTSGMIQSLTGDGLYKSWPPPGRSIGAGWKMSATLDDSGIPLNYIVDASGATSNAVAATNPTPTGWLQPQFVTVQYTLPYSIAIPSFGIITDVSAAAWSAKFPIGVYKIRFNVDYEASRKRTETVTAVVTADVQQVLSDPADSDAETMTISSQFPGEAVDPGGAIPIGDLRRNSYFQTDRGTASFEYLLLLARAKLRARARTVDISFGVPWAMALTIGLRNSVALADYRIPGGSATGKVKAARLIVGESGMWGEFTIGCTIGRGSPATAMPAVNAYAQDGYMLPGYQAVTGGFDLIAGELAYQPLTDFVVVDDGINLLAPDAASVIDQITIANPYSAQVAAVQAAGANLPLEAEAANGRIDLNPAILKNGLKDPLGTLRDMPTRITLDLKPIAGSQFHTEFAPAVTRLALPMTIDLEAAG